MFGIDLSSHEFPKGDPKEERKSYVQLKSDTANAFLNITMSSAVCSELAEQLGSADGFEDIFNEFQISDAQMEQDIVCELANILGHVTQKHLSTQYGKQVKTELPRNGSLEIPQSDACIFRLGLITKQEDDVRIDFVYSELPMEVKPEDGNIQKG
jgi:hypothetical protein